MHAFYNTFTYIHTCLSLASNISSEFRYAFLAPGTSQAAGIVGGMAAIVAQYFIDGHYVAPGADFSDP